MLKLEQVVWAGHWACSSGCSRSRHDAGVAMANVVCGRQCPIAQTAGAVAAAPAALRMTVLRSGGTQLSVTIQAAHSLHVHASIPIHAQSLRESFDTLHAFLVWRTRYSYMETRKVPLADPCRIGILLAYKNCVYLVR